MAKKIIIATIILLLGILGFFIGTKLTGQPGTKNATPIPTAVDLFRPGSLNDILFANVALQCSFDNDGDLGTAFVSSGKARFDFDATIYYGDEELNYKYHMIVYGAYLYIWRNDEKTGLITSTSVLLPAPVPSVLTFNESQQYMTGDFYSNANYSYNCEPWQEDLTVFDIPKDIEFVRSTTLETTPLPIPSNNIVVPQ